jgi:hypothetical protein
MNGESFGGALVRDKNLLLHYAHDSVGSYESQVLRSSDPAKIRSYDGQDFE